MNTIELVAAICIVLATGCAGSQKPDPEDEIERTACHVQAKLEAEQQWEDQCGDSLWDDCPDAEEITSDLNEDLKKCDEEALQ